VSNVVARLLCDDGAVVYLNGLEIWRHNLPATGSISYNTPASSDVTGANETTWVTRSFGTLPFQTGSNLLAVEVHQFTNKSPDLSFDLELTGTQMLTDQPPLTVSRAGNAMLLFSWPPVSGSFTLCTTTNFALPAVWERVPDTPILCNGQWSLQLPITADECRFYRLLPE